MSSANRIRKTLLIAIALLGIALTFLFQDFNFLNDSDISEVARFILRKSLRVLLNDGFMLLLVHAWFNDHSITRLAIFIQLFDSLILLPLYFAFKIYLEGPTELSAPLLSQFHRLIINPTLMILLIPAVYFQKLSSR